MNRSKILKKYSKGNKNAKLKVISLGLGVQSTALYLMSSMGCKVPRADYAIFADPQAEHQKTYELLDWLLDWKEKNNGIEIIINKDHNILEDILQSKNSLGAKWVTVPAFGEKGGMVQRQCTGEYKIRPVQNSVRKLHKLRKRQKMLPTEMWLGISLDEIERMKKSQMYNITYFYPLIYHEMTRKDCLVFFENNKFPTPIKSSCVFCPYHSDEFWKDIKEENLDAWTTAVKVDKSIRNQSRRGEDDKLYLHRSLKSLDQINFEKNQLNIFEGFDCEGHCGL